jgi:hypothetical protein
MLTIQQLKQNREKVPEFCQTQLWPDIERFELEHKIDTSEVKTAVLRAILPGAGGWFVNLFNFHYAPIVAVVLWATAAFFIMPALVRFLAKSGERAKAFATLRADIKLRSLRFLDPNIVFTPQVAFPKDLYNLCGLPSDYDSARAEDHCSGQVGETRYELMEVAVHKVRKSKDSKGNTTTTYVPVFVGLIFKADFNKNFEGYTTIRRDYAESKFGFIGRSAQRLMSSASSQKLVELENPQFEEKYKVESSHPVEARYILTPDFMERILELDARYPGVQLAFRDGAAFFAIPYGRNFLELGNDFQNVTSSVENLLSDLITVLEITEAMKLNERIWNKKALGA